MDGAKRGQKKTGTIAERDLKLISTAYFEMFSIKNFRPNKKDMERFIRRFHHRERFDAKGVNRKVAKMYINE